MKEILNVLFSKITRTKAILALVPAVIVITLNIAITPVVLVIITAPIGLYIIMEGLADYLKVKYPNEVKEIAEKAVLLALSAVLALGVSGPLYAQNAPLATPESEIEAIGETPPGLENCPEALIECQISNETLQERIIEQESLIEAYKERLKTMNAPAIITGPIFERFAWYQTLPEWAKFLIPWTADGAIAVGLGYAGIVIEQNQR